MSLQKIISYTQQADAMNSPTSVVGATQNSIGHSYSSISPPTQNELVVFTDGACTHNGKPYAIAAYAVVWPKHPELDGGHKLPPGEIHTNNRAEYRALLHALQQADTLDPNRQRPLRVYTDSELMINSFTKWIKGWKKKDWKKSDGKPVLNIDLVKSIDALLEHRNVSFQHVAAHTGRKDWASIHNAKVDELARKATLGISVVGATKPS